MKIEQISSTNQYSAGIKNTAYYIALRIMTTVLFAILLVMAICLMILPNKASADTNTQTYTIPVPGLYYQVGPDGRPIGVSTQYSCVAGVCNPVQTSNTQNNTTQNTGFTLTSSNGNPIGNTNTQGNNPAQQGTNNSLAAYSSGPYPRYLTPVVNYSSGNLAVYPYPSYQAPVAVISNPNIGSDGNTYLPYPTYGKTPVYGRIMTAAFNGNVPVQTATNGQFGTTSNVANTAPLTNTSSTGGFIMTSSGF